MPIFEFRCRSCGDEFEQLVRNAETPACPDCASTQLDKLMSAPVGRVAGHSLPIAGGTCPPSDAPPCSPHCCRLPS